KLYNSFKTYGVNNHVFEVIIECSEKALKTLETIHGIKLNALDPKIGLNIVLPKLENGLGGCSEEKIRWNKGTKGLMKVWNKGLKGCQNAWNKGIPISEESKKKLSESLKGRVSSKKGIKWT